MKTSLAITPLESSDISQVTLWARVEGFAPGVGDVDIYRHTDRQGLWLARLDNKPVGCISGVRYNSNYGFIGMFIVAPPYRGNGYGLALWKHSLEYLNDLPCIGLEAAPDRIKDYSNWGFLPSSSTTRWEWKGNSNLLSEEWDLYRERHGLQLFEGESISARAVQDYDAYREPSPRPHFLSDWLQHPAGTVLALGDRNGQCHGFGRIRPCLLNKGKGWRIGPLLADTPKLAELLLRHLINQHPGVVLIDSPGANPYSQKLLNGIGFHSVSNTMRMYRGAQPPISLNEVYGLACLELG